jgi:hypothetical protein
MWSAVRTAGADASAARVALVQTKTGLLAAQGCKGRLRLARRLRASAPPRSPSAGFRCGQHPCSERGGPLLDAAGSPSLLEGEGVRGRGETALCNAPNHIFARMFCPSLNSAGDVGGGSHGCGACLRCEHHVGAAPRGRPWAGLGTPSWRIALLRIVVRADPTGAAPQAPRGGTVPVPQTPPQVAWSDCAGAVVDASAAIGGWRHE